MEAVEERARAKSEAVRRKGKEERARAKSEAVRRKGKEEVE